MRIVPVFAGLALLAVAAAPSPALAGAMPGCWRQGCPAYDKAHPPATVQTTNTQTEWDVDVVPPAESQYAHDGSKLGREQSDDFSGTH